MVSTRRLLGRVSEARAWEYVSGFARTGRHVAANTGVRHANEHAAVLLLAHGLDSAEAKTRLNRLGTLARKKRLPAPFKGSMQGAFQRDGASSRRRDDYFAR